MRMNGVTAAVSLVTAILALIGLIMLMLPWERRSGLQEASEVGTYRRGGTCQSRRQVSTGQDVSVRVEVSGEMAVQIDVGPNVKPCADVREVVGDDWSDF